jgi:hypothetical protein
MSKFMREDELLHLQNLARKARRRGDAVEAARWQKAINLHQMAQDRFEAAFHRRIRLERADYEWRAAQQEKARRKATEEASRQRRPSLEERMMAELGPDIFDR